MKLRPFLAGITLSVVSTWAWAGGSAVIEAGMGTNAVRTAIEFGDGNMRMGTAMPGMEGYMVMTETGIYMVTGMGGRPTVLDLGALMSMMGGMAGDMLQAQGVGLNNGIGQVIELADTGREEVVAGIIGRVYNLTFTNDRGNPQTQEIVLGRDPALRELSNTMATWARMMAAYVSVDVGGYQDTMDTLLAHGDGILRMGSAYRLVSLDGSAPPAARFTLPAAPQQLPAWLP